MKSSQPYQPLLLRLLHGTTGILLIAAVVTAFWTYDTYDGRWGRIPLPRFEEIEGIHGSFGLFALSIFPALVLYACHRGQRRLIQPDSIDRLTQVGQPIWWYTLSRITNTLSMLAVTFALFSGKMMDDTWLPKGELSHGWYYAHLLSWVVVVVCIALHVLMNARVGGAALLLSMWNWRFRSKDLPTLWPAHVSRWWSDLRSHRLAQQQFDPAIVTLEIVVLTSLVAAWIIPLFKS
jgi:hypothetical protein